MFTVLLLLLFFQDCLVNRFLKLETIIRWLENHQLVCFYKSTLGIECPGCGTQRAFILLLRGEFSESFLAYPPLLLFLSLMLLLLSHLVFKFRKGGTYLMYLFLFTVLVVLINFIYKSSKNETLRKIRNEKQDYSIPLQQ